MNNPSHFNKPAIEEHYYSKNYKSTRS